MCDQPEPTTKPVDISEVMLWMLRPASECTLENPEYADFAKRFDISPLAGSMKRPAGGYTLEELVLASYGQADRTVIAQGAGEASKSNGASLTSSDDDKTRVRGYRGNGPGNYGYREEEVSPRIYWTEAQSEAALSRVLQRRQASPRQTQGDAPKPLDKKGK